MRNVLKTVLGLALASSALLIGTSAFTQSALAATPAYVAGTHAASAGKAPNATPAAMPAVVQAPLGSNAYSWNSQSGPYYTIFDIAVPGTLPNIAAFPATDFVGAGEYYNGLVYMIDNANMMYEVTPATGAILNQYPVTAPPTGETYSGLAVDPTTGVVYASSTSVVTSSLFTVVPSTGVATLIGSLTGSAGMIAISFDGAGDLYGYDIVSDSMYSIDTTNANVTDLGALPFDPNFGQGMGYDPATDTVYLAAYNNGTSQAELYTYDTGTNTYTFMGVLGGTVPGGLNQLSWLGFGGTAVTWTVTPNVVGGNGSIAPNTPQTVPNGGTIVFTLTPDAGYEIDTVSGCGGALAGNVYTAGPITDNCTVNASFRLTPVAAPAHLVPTLNSWVLGLLGLLMAGVALLLWSRRTG